MSVIFGVNDTVRYGNAGVCKITDKVIRVLGREEMQYFELHPVHDSRSCVFVPVNNKELMDKMSCPMTAEDARILVTRLPELSPLWNDIEIDRRRLYREILSNGDREEIARIVVTLYARDKDLKAKGKKLRMDDERCLREATRLLHDELAFAWNVDPEEVPGRIAEMLRL